MFDLFIYFFIYFLSIFLLLFFFLSPSFLSFSAALTYLDKFTPSSLSPFDFSTIDFGEMGLQMSVFRALNDKGGYNLYPLSHVYSQKVSGTVIDDKIKEVLFTDNPNLRN